MAALKSFGTLLLFVSVACCIYFFLLPAGNVSKTAKKLLSVFFLLSVTAPLFSMLRQESLRASPSLPAGTEDVSAEESRFAAAGEAAVKRAAARVLDAGTDVPYELVVRTHIEEDMRIDIVQVTVIFGREFAGRRALTAQLTETLGAPVRSEVKNAARTVETPVEEAESG